MSNRLLKALACGGRVRIYICDTTEIVQEAKNRHGLWPTASAALGRVLSAGCMMGSNLKSEKEKLTITINGGTYSHAGTDSSDGGAVVNAHNTIADSKVIVNGGTFSGHQVKETGDVADGRVEWNI